MARSRERERVERAHSADSPPESATASILSRRSGTHVPFGAQLHLIVYRNYWGIT